MDLDYTLEIKDKNGLLLEVSSIEDICQVPTNSDERSACMTALSDALRLLSETNSIQSISSKEFENDVTCSQNSQGLGDYRVAYHYAPPSTPQEGNPKHEIRLVSVLGTLIEN